MDGHHLNAIMAPFVNFYILNLVYGPILHFVSAENWSVIFVEDAPGFVDNYHLYLSSMHKDYPESHDYQGNEILPPVALSVAFKQHTVLAKS